LNGWATPRRGEVARALAGAFLAGGWDEPGMVTRASAAFARRPRWLAQGARHALATYRERPADRPRELAAVLDAWLAELAAAGRLPQQPPSVHHVPLFESAMGRMRWPVPEIATIADLAAFLDLHIRELQWLADPRTLERSVRDRRLRNYHYSWLARPSGAARVIEQPKRLLKQTQRRLLHQVIDRIPPHDAAHGFRPGHSAITHARRHTGRRVVIRFDLEDFFASVAAGRVYGIFREAGYPEAVAHCLTALASNVVPAEEWARVPRPADGRLIAAHARLGRRLATPHLPQGAPTSPALANLSCHRLDCRLSALAEAAGGSYSRYADDLVISGDGWLTAYAGGIRSTVEEIVRAEGFRLNPRKSRLTTRAGRQQVTGLVVNEHPNVTRHEYDRLKAILHDAVANGPQAANRAGVADFRAHLTGRVAWVAAVNPNRGRRLGRRLAAIEWS
jgi:RNA-directed DNA polymerase